MATPAQWQQLKAILAAVLELPTAERTEFLDRRCAGDTALRAELDRLLAAEESVRTDFLGDTAARQNIASISTVMRDPRIGHRVGPYKIVEPIGEGGMGTVYRAVRADDEYQKQVAVKLVHAGRDSAFIVERFKNERQILASLEHTNIARLLDGGTADDGSPYFVMELIEGLPIDRYCDQHRLPIPERLRLFLQVCAAVQFAHERLIIHRDIKPGNILVGADVVPKLLDFGIAKILETDAPKSQQDATMTLFQVLTPAYASPEQVQGQAITTASDVYSLGVVLYELLTGSRPIDPKRGALDEILRQLREHDPALPSAKVLADPKSAKAVSEKRSTSPQQLASSLRGDLDCIALKALEKDKSRRYATPAELAADLGRYLSHEAVTARPSSTIYRIKKYAVRHRIGVTAVSTVVALLIAFGATEFHEVRRITRERDRADRISSFMTNMFKVSDPSEAKGNSVTAREILDKASTEIEKGLAKDAEVRADLMYTMAETYQGLGLYPRAQTLFEHAVEIQQKLLGPRDPKSLRSMSALASTMLVRGNLTDSDKRLREVLATQTEVLGPQHFDTLRTMSALAAAEYYQGHYADSEKSYRQILAIDNRVFGPEAYETLRTMDGLGAALEVQRRNTEAETIQRHALASYTRDFGLENPDTLGAMNNLAITLESERHFDEAEKLYRQTVEVQRKILGPEHSDTMRSVNNLANTLQLEGRYPEAEQLERQVLEVRSRTLGPEHQMTLTAANNLADTLQLEGQLPEAERLARETLAVQRRVLGTKHPDTCYTMADLGMTLTREGKYAQAEDLYHEAVKSATESGEDDLSDILYEYAHAAMVAGHRDQALQHLHEAVEKGYTDVGMLTAEKDFNPLHGDPNYETLVADLNRHAPK